MPWQDTVTAVSSAIQAVGVIFAAVAVGIAACQLGDARTALRATTMLQIQKDGRELFGSTDPDVASYLYAFDRQKKYDPVVVEKGRIRAIQILNYYASASRQHDVGTVDDQLWDSIKREFCRVVTTQEPFQRLWKQAVQNKIYDANFIKAGNQCSGTTSSPSATP